MKLIPDESVDLVLTDPPYNTTDCKWDKKIIWDDLWAEWKRIIKPTGSIVLTCQMPMLANIVVGGIDWYRHRWIWNKDKCGNFLVSKYEPLKYTEDVLVFSKSGYKQAPNVKIKKVKSIYNPQMTINDLGKPKKTNSDRFGLSVNEFNARGKSKIFKLKTDALTDGKHKYPKDILYFTVPHKKEDRFHPTQKPVLLMEYLIKTYTNEGMSVLDCFFGSGTTGVACVNTNRNFIGIEQDDKYFEIAKERINATKESR